MIVDKSAFLYQRASKHLAMGVSSGLRKSVTPVPLYFDHADGPLFFDVDGNCYVDYTLAWGPLIAGSNHPRVNAAVSAQLARGYTYGAQHADEIEVAEAICRAVPGVEQVIFSNTGTEAIQVALRIARAYTGRSKIIKFEGHYHGWMNNVLVSYRPKAEQMGHAAPTCGGQPSPEFADTIALPWDDVAAVERCLNDHAGQIAAVITEPILVNSGSLMPHAGYLEALGKLCQSAGALLLFDEVITGFRIALGGAREHFGLQPDISIYAKAIAGGFSFAAAGGRQEIFDVLRDGRTLHAGTYNGNCIALAAARATIEILSEPGIFQRMHAHGYAIRQTIERMCARVGIACVTTGLGSVFSVHFGITEAPRRYADFLSADTKLYNQFRAQMLEQGVLLLPEGRWYVGTTHTQAQLSIVCRAIEQALESIRT